MISWQKTNGGQINVKRYLVILVAIWTLTIFASLFWNRYQGKLAVLSMARLQARVAYQRDVIYRRWNADHGGVYVPVTAKTIPDPYLDEPNRDITGPSGIRLTLMNPA